jgi:hypothetical protein
MCTGHTAITPQPVRARVDPMARPGAPFSGTILTRYCDVVVAGAAERSIPLAELIEALQQQLPNRR